MADPTTHPDFDLDTALSADLDGELDAYASELGLPVADVRAAIAGPAGDARRAALAGARDAARHDAAPAAPLDDLTRRRLLAGAGVGPPVRAASSPDRGRFLRPVAAAAVTLLVLGGLYAILHDSGGSGGSGGSAAKSEAGSAAAAAVTGDLGDVGTIDANQVAGFLRGKVVHGPTEKAADRAAPNGGATFSAAAPGAADTCAAQYTKEGAIRFRGSGAYQGRPAVVLGIDTGSRTIVFVVSAADCAQVLYSASR